ncbi:MAG: hypothetical protein ABIK09_11710 [Pseudomonadota bacterium]
MSGETSRLVRAGVALLTLFAACGRGPVECPGDTEAARAVRAASAEAHLRALGEGFFTVASFRTVDEDLVHWKDVDVMEGASTEEKRLVFYRLRFEAELVFSGVDLPPHPLQAALPVPTWDAVNRNEELLRLVRPRGRSPGDREIVSARAIFDVTGPETTCFRAFDEQEREQLVPFAGCPDGRGGAL